MGQRDAMLANGVEFLYTNIHTHHGMYPLYQNQKPYFWENEDGKRLLVWSGEHYNLGTHPTFQSAVKARRAAEERLHDPAIIAHIETLTEERRKEFAMYLRNNGGTI